MIFDCCRADEAIATWRAPVGRAPSILPSLRNDFYIVFSCDPGRRAVDFEDGGFIVPRVMRLLPYAQPLTVIWEEAVLNANKDGRPLQ